MSTSTQIRAARTVTPTEYRTDIDGLRAVAILLVVVYHVWVGRVSGGVDAFLMISAFFLTGSFVRRLESQRPLAIAGQWLRTFKRLLPPAAVVLTGTLIVGWFILPETRIQDLLRETWASLFYFENWWLANEATDYYANKVDASPVQHFWSLSVQGQVFLLWPLLFVAALLIVKRFATGVRPTVTAILGVVFLASFAYSVVSTGARQEFAYFDTAARLWEFAAGGLLAVILPWIRLSLIARRALGWIGILALVTCGLLLDVQGGFPGYLALWPILSVTAIILAGSRPIDTEASTPLVTKVLSTKALVVLGRDAYSLYLIHWPILIFTLQLQRGTPLTLLQGLLVIIASLLGARLMTWLVDDRIRYARWANTGWLRGLMVIIVSISLVSVSTGYLSWKSDKLAEAAEVEIEQLDAADSFPGAAAVGTPGYAETSPEIPPIPLPSTAENEWGSLQSNCDENEYSWFSNADAGCNVTRSDAPNLTAVIIGSSHAQQWLNPLDAIAQDENWQMYSFVMGGCNVGLADEFGYFEGEYLEKCFTWIEESLQAVQEIRPDIVLLVGTQSYATDSSFPEDAGESEHIPFGQQEVIDRLQASGTFVVSIRDNPRFTFDMYECALSVYSGDATGEQFGARSDCGISRHQALASTNPAELLRGSGVGIIDMSDYLCPDEICSAVIGNVYVYLDDNHITSTYAETMIPQFKEQLLEAIPEPIRR